MSTDNTFENLLTLSDSDLNAQMMDGSAPDGEVATNDEAVSTAAPSTDSKADTAQADSSVAAAAAKVEEVQPQGVLAKDEKHILPFKVVEDLRVGKAEAERLARDLQAQLDAMKADKANGTSSAKEIDIQGLFSEEQLADLQKDMPEFANGIRALQNTVKDLASERATEKEQRDHDEQQRQISERDAVRTTVQEAIDQTPKLLHLQSTDPIAFQRAKEIDIERSKNPATAAHWNALPLADRFAQVMTDYEARFGAVKVASLPEKAAPADKPATESKPAQKAAPLSLSDLPGGAAPAIDSRAEMAAKAGPEIISNMANWTQAQLDSYFAAL